MSARDGAGAHLALVEGEHREAFERLLREVVVRRDHVREEDVGLFPPSSSVTGMRFCEAYCMISRPVVVSPVKATLAIRLLAPAACRPRRRTRSPR